MTAAALPTAVWGRHRPTTRRAWQRSVVGGRLMGTTCHVFVVAANADAAQAIADQCWTGIREFDRAWSRFDPASELSRFNRLAAHAPTEFDVSEVMVSLLNAAHQAYDYSGGLVDAAVLPEVVAAGYDRDYDAIDQAGSLPLGPPVDVINQHRLAAVSFRGAQAVVDRPLHVDSGGIGKGLAADVLSKMAMSVGAVGVVVEIGGDLRAIGVDSDGQAWTVSVDATPNVSHSIRSFQLVDGGVATSSCLKRRIPGGHHIIDPRTGHPAKSDLASVTVCAPTAIEAEIAAKAALILGKREGLRFLAERGLAGVLTDARGWHTSIESTNDGGVRHV